jgi:hypothetical protein
MEKGAGGQGPGTGVKKRKALRALDYMAPQIIGFDNKINGQGIRVPLSVFLCILDG